MVLGEIVVVVLLSAAFYMFLRYKLMLAVQPYRLQLARRGEALLAHPHLSDHHKEMIRFMLDCAFSKHVLFIAVIATPFIVFAMLVNRRFRAFSNAHWKIVDEELRREVEEVDSLFRKSLTATSPLLAVIYWLERALLFVIVALISFPLELVDIAADRAYSISRRNYDEVRLT